ncbi:MAG: transporter substrate-binding domain-containing protein, partial [Spirochaetales bacterium]|nr:transporter substrate-binding domain-containing protein [Spirochaetales bacterium]
MKKILTLLIAFVTLFSFSSCKKSESAKVWIIATDTVFRPFEYTDADNNFVGIDVDILAAIAEDQGFRYTLQSLGWDAG